MQRKHPLPAITKMGIILVTVATMILAGCGGGGGGGGGSSPVARTIGGVAAVGAPIVNGNINVICAAGSALTTTTNSAGSWTVTLSGQTLPCAVEASGGTINGAGNITPYHSIAVAAGTANVTPLTDLLVANLAGTASPDAWFAGLNSIPALLSAITQTQVDTSLANLNAAFSVLPLYTSSTHPITASFTPVAGNPYDDMLAALRTALTNAGVTYTTLLGSAATSGFPPPPGLIAALTTAYQGTASGNNLTYFPVNLPVTILNATSLSLTMTGSYIGNSLVYTGTNSLGPANQTFLGQPASSANTTAYVSVNGMPSPPFYSTNYFSVAPYKNLGYSSTTAYAVYANQIALPATAIIGSSGNFDSGTDYADSTRTTTLDTFVERWSLQAGTIPGTASLCINTVTTAVASSATSGSSNYCLTIDTNGNILGVQTTGPINGTMVTLASTSITAIPPTVISTNPPNNATSVAASSAISATFSEPIDPATISAATFTLMNGIFPVSGTVTYTGTTATFTPAASLAANTLYTATVTTGVKGLSGNAMTSNYSWSFQTSVAPSVLSVSPLPYAYAVAPGSAITATFAAAVNPATVTGTSFTLTRSGATPVAGAVTYSGNTATFTPSLPLVANTIYTATITTAVKDLAGTTMGSNYSWTFQTFAPGTAATSVPFSPAPAGLWQPAVGATPAAGTGSYVYLQSDVGDWIGQGQTYTYTALNSTLAFIVNGGHLLVRINGATWWYGNFQTPNTLSQFQPAYYPGVLRYPFNNPVLGGLDWSGDGRGCNTLQGWFVVDNATYVNGVLTAIDLRFEQQCEMGTTALHGVIHWGP